MHRLLLALGLSALLWTAARTAPVPHDIVSICGAGSCAVAGDSHLPNDSDQQWQAAHHAIGVITESPWKSAPVHAGIGATRVAVTFETSRAVNAPDPPAASSLPYLRHTPLLI